MSESLTLKDLENLLKRALRNYDIDQPELEARWMIEHVTGLGRSDQILVGGDAVASNHEAALMQILNRRLDGEPLDHIFGYKEFYGLRFTVNQYVLSPRPETELLVDFVLDRTEPSQSFNVLDLGTGSGAIIIAILSQRPMARGVGVDISRHALEVAKQNAISNTVDKRILFEKGDWIIPENRAFEFILSNPPYIDSDAMTRLDQEVRDFDPELALHGGDDGLSAYRQILRQLNTPPQREFTVAVEIGYDQGKAVSGLFEQFGITDVEVLKDLAGRDRVVHGIAAKQPTRNFDT